MRVFVTGATGFVGRHLVRSLLADGHEVRALARSDAGSADLAATGVDVVRGDVVDAEAMRRAVEGREVVYHVAGAQPRPGLEDAVFHDANLTGTENVARAAAEAGVRRFVHCSTVAVYGWAKRLPVDERTPTNPDGVYAETKLRSEEIVRERCRETAMTAAIVRIARIYGPGDTSFARIFSDVIGGRFVMIGRGSNSYHLVYVDDVVSALVACGASTRDETYVVAGGDVSTLREFVDTIAKVDGVAPPSRSIPAFPFTAAAAVGRLLLKPFGREPNLMHKLVFFLKGHAYDVSKARAQLGFEPAVSLDEGVRRTIAWYRSEGHLRA